jgi:hypothetical protein
LGKRPMPFENYERSPTVEEVPSTIDQNKKESNI